ncbi:collagen alpha 1(Xviii) chain [Elysia marginata]|uniref:Collagen alpha 1(Xviii) chain n=1 Tax=Elysia marginata TaxID=1093978 RepID=A0AAV4HL43_9GAST|nr:collagen alpha 1(Xviii) chain [Elysia marginata]
MLALNKPLAGSMRGIRGADHECYRQARRNNLRGTYRAFLSSATQDLNSIIYYSRDRQVPIVNARNQILFDSWEKITDGSGAYFNDKVPIYSFNGDDIMTDSKWPQKIIWHGSNSKGEFVGGKYCNRWHSSSNRQRGRASSLMKHMLLDEEDYSCNNSFIVLCIENTAQRTL